MKNWAAFFHNVFENLKILFVLMVGSICAVLLVITVVYVLRFLSPVPEKRPAVIEVSPGNNRWYLERDIREQPLDISTPDFVKVIPHARTYTKVVNGAPHTSTWYDLEIKVMDGAPKGEYKVEVLLPQQQLKLIPLIVK